MTLSLSEREMEYALCRVEEKINIFYDKTQKPSTDSINFNVVYNTSPSNYYTDCFVYLNGDGTWVEDKSKRTGEVGFPSDCCEVTLLARDSYTIYTFLPERSKLISWLYKSSEVLGQFLLYPQMYSEELMEYLFFITPFPGRIMSSVEKTYKYILDDIDCFFDSSGLEFRFSVTPSIDPSYYEEKIVV